MEYLPVEKVFEICEQMDLLDLNNFVRTNKTYQNICYPILNRKLDERIDELIKQSKLNFSITLNSILPNIFYLYYFPDWENKFIIEEEIEIPIKDFGLVKVGLEPPETELKKEFVSDESGIRNALKRLFLNGYLDGTFEKNF